MANSDQAASLAPSASAVTAHSGTGMGSAPVAGLDADLLHRRGERITPHDYAIGPLQDLLAAGPVESAVTRTLVDFFRALAAGTIEQALIAPDWRQSLTRSLRFHLQEGLQQRAMRIGEVAVTEQRAHANIRVFGQPGRVAGEAYLEVTAEGWRIVDLQLDWRQLALPYTTQEREFVPRADRWLLLR